MLVIRFFRVGKRNQPSFKIVVTDKKRASRGGRYIEEVGFWSPLTKERKLKGERIKHWISVGAKPSDSIHNLLIEEKIIEGKKIPVHKTPKESKHPTGQESKKATSEGGEPRPNKFGREAKPKTTEVPKETTPKSIPESKPEIPQEKPQEVVPETSPEIIVEKPVEEKPSGEKPTGETPKTE
ncbi:MAG: 30S ribosomal protein S16 [Candidatus Magasanikbacteria bacterium]|nr:30S ribosomal protein S16 [Candidatus Magasanikbacteria bacterium]